MRSIGVSFLDWDCYFTVHVEQGKTLIARIGPSAESGNRDWETFKSVRYVETIDGKRTYGPVARRMRDGEWQYRELTDEEIAEYQSFEAW